ncbi:MAG: alpha-L-fucosidase [Anaerolineae bacterium]
MTSNREGGSMRYEPMWESLDKHSTPKWFDDAKFGIFIHWGVYAVPAYHEWYVTFMSPKARFGRNLGGPPYTATRGDLAEDVFKANIREDAYAYHRKKFGPSFAYDDFIPMFTAEHFAPAEWASLFKQAGARYVVLTAKHGDEFALWPSKHTPRNAGDMGPHRDLVGYLTEAVRREDLKMGFYHNTTYSFWDERYPEPEWVAYMNDSIKELVDRYQPSVLWGDTLTGPATDANGKPLGAEHWHSKDVLAYYYNHSPEPDEVVANDRWGIGEDGRFHGDYYTPERERLDAIRPDKWEACDSLDPQSWGYNARLGDQDYMSVKEAVHLLVDVVSKNGNLLLNIGPKADGTIPQAQQDRLLGIGQWLKVNGEAIYGARPWVVAEGSTAEGLPLRFTKKTDSLYVFLLGTPDGGQVTLEGLGNAVCGAATVRLLGQDAPLAWQQEQRDLVVAFPDDAPESVCHVLKITPALERL